jgi:hypothetical protein
MHGVVSLLDNTHHQLVEDLWAELEQAFAVRGVYVTPYPHFSYHVARHYDIEALEPVLQRLAASSIPFRVQTTGLGIFTGPQPVLYIPVVRSLELSQFHEALWDATMSTGSGIQNYYHPKNWMPHITIGFVYIAKANLPQIVRLLAERAFSWEITVDNIALIYDTGIRQELRSRFDFGNNDCKGSQV